MGHSRGLFPPASLPRNATQVTAAQSARPRRGRKEQQQGKGRCLRAKCKEGRGKRDEQARTEMAAGAGGNKSRKRWAQRGSPGRTTSDETIQNHAQIFVLVTLTALRSLPPPSRRHRLHHDAATRGGDPGLFRDPVPFRSRLVSLNTPQTTGTGSQAHTRPGAWVALHLHGTRHRPKRAGE